MFGFAVFVAANNFASWQFAQMTYRKSLRDIEACLGRSPRSRPWGLRISGNAIDILGGHEDANDFNPAKGLRQNKRFIMGMVVQSTDVRRGRWCSSSRHGSRHT
jgi:hypothetical protein